MCGCIPEIDRYNQIKNNKLQATWKYLKTNTDR